MLHNQQEDEKQFDGSEGYVYESPRKLSITFCSYRLSNMHVSFLFSIDSTHNKRVRGFLYEQLSKENDTYPKSVVMRKFF